jgi:hypothetical protein
MSYFLGLFVFILSVISGLILMITSKNIRREKFLLFASFHLLLFLAFIASLLLQKDNDKIVINYFFLFYVCSGITLSGMAWRIQVFKFLKYYFSVFILTIPLFLVSPSTLLNLILTLRASGTNGPSYHIMSRYFIEEQNNSLKTNNTPLYKVIQKRGMFHKTIQRDLDFGGRLDSIRLLESDNKKTIRIRGFTGKTTFVSETIDSTDIEFYLVKPKKGSVEYRLTN